MTDPESESSHLGSMEAELTGLADGLDGDRKEKRNTRLTRKAPHQYGMWPSSAAGVGSIPDLW